MMPHFFCVEEMHLLALKFWLCQPMVYGQTMSNVNNWVPHPHAYNICYQTWFWFKLSSMACSSPTLSGTFWIWFLERSTTSKWRRPQSCVGTVRSWFPERFKVLRAESCPNAAGSCLKWLPFKCSVSSFFSLHSSSGRAARNKSHNKEMT